MMFGIGRWCGLFGNVWCRMCQIIWLNWCGSELLLQCWLQWWQMFFIFLVMVVQWLVGRFGQKWCLIWWLRLFDSMLIRKLLLMLDELCSWCRYQWLCDLLCRYFLGKVFDFVVKCLQKMIMQVQMLCRLLVIRLFSIMVRKNGLVSSGKNMQFFSIWCSILCVIGWVCSYIVWVFMWFFSQWLR